jgi:hypothetical protein
MIYLKNLFAVSVCRKLNNTPRNSIYLQWRNLMLSIQKCRLFYSKLDFFFCNIEMPITWQQWKLYIRWFYNIKIWIESIQKSHTHTHIFERHRARRTSTRSQQYDVSNKMNCCSFAVSHSSSLVTYISQRTKATELTAIVTSPAWSRQKITTQSN